MQPQPVPTGKPVTIFWLVMATPARRRFLGTEACCSLCSDVVMRQVDVQAGYNALVEDLPPANASAAH